MPSVQQVGATDYSQMPVAQNNVPVMDDYMNEPQVYDPEFEEKKSASSSMKGLTILGTMLGVAGVGYGIYKGRVASKYKAQKEMLENEVIKLKEKVQDEKGFKPYMKRTITGSWLFKTLWTWPKNGIKKAWNFCFKKGSKDAAKK